MKCKYCNAQIPNDSRFCAACGKKLLEVSPCPHCGAAVNSGDTFCPYCGKK